MNEAQVRKLLRTQIEAAGGLRAFGREHEIDPTYVGRVANQDAPLTDAILKALNLEKRTVTTYKRVRK